ncbi:PhoH family protein [Herbivorax sp. ANBcel31]|uniref:PhoH family protein n=1 Tax=Herbivorax sp. ANBcel31 TaxID=3069754 RepID=UPI0027AE871B|nr:PhoH family protein [Herbivorax sp. ANBcel31]MDQ2085002.1 PhoH family protein [Herbivorax sp. ANBcel31]
MKKTFVLDTNVLLQTPYALHSFGDNTIVIPEVVLEELDKFKKENTELGANARHTARFLDELRLKGNLNEGVELENGGVLKVELSYTSVKMPESWDDSNNDNRILKLCKGLMEDGETVFLVTKDIFERIKADILGITAQDFFAEQVPEYHKQYRGRREVYTTKEKIDGFYKDGCININDIYIYKAEYTKKTTPMLTKNEFLIIHSETNEKQTALGRFDGKNIVPLIFLKERPFGVSPRNAGQKFMQEALMTEADKAPLVIVKGPAGTAKTFYSLAVGLHKIMAEQKKLYRKILVCRPNVKLDEDIGFLPGSEQEKIAPYLRPVIDNLEVLVDNDENERYSSENELKDKIDELFDRKIINTEAIAFIRGRSIVKQWVIIDEAQNLTPKQVKGIITRAGAGTKIILIGDPEQIDQPFLDIRTNGLCYASERMKGSHLCYQLTLFDEECERSELAYEGAKRML